MEETAGHATFPNFIIWKHLWNIDKMSASKLVDGTYQKNIRRGIGLRQEDSVRDRLGDWFVEASVQVKRSQVLYMKRALESSNALVRALALMTCRDNLGHSLRYPVICLL